MSLSAHYACTTTADIVCREAHPATVRETEQRLIHEMPLREALAALAQARLDRLLVGHQPLAGKLVESLCGLHAGATSIGTANLIEMEGDAFISGALHIVHHQSP